MLSDLAEKPVRLYDTRGAYTDETATIDLGKGAPRVREPWIEKRGYARVEGRAVKPEDNSVLDANGSRAGLSGGAAGGPRRGRPEGHAI